MVGASDELPSFRKLLVTKIVLPRATEKFAYIYVYTRSVYKVVRLIFKYIFQIGNPG